jgi:2-C-methyl-D-erythritol 4-phosphate cytidylyltransferase
MTVAAIVAAAGRGERLGAHGPKALVEVAGKPLVVHAVSRLRAAGCDVVVVAAPADALDAFAAVLADVTIVGGAVTRQGSVATALDVLPDDVDVVLVHDAARGLSPSSVAESVIAAVRAGADAVVPVLPVADTVKEVDSAGWVRRTLDRNALRAVQTPQGFRRLVLERAHQAAESVDSLDDASLVESLGLTVRTVPGDPAGLKVTTRADLLTVAALVGEHVG